MEYQVVSVRFNRLGKQYYFSTGDKDLHKGDKVVVETIRGIEMGEVSSDVKTVGEKDVVLPLKPIIRVATESDIHQDETNKADEPYVMRKTNELVKRNDLEMKLLNCEYTLDRSKLIIYFNAEGRVD